MSKKNQATSPHKKTLFFYRKITQLLCTKNHATSATYCFFFWFFFYKKCRFSNIVMVLKSALVENFFCCCFSRGIMQFLKLYWSYYLHQSRYSVFPVCGIFSPKNCLVYFMTGSTISNCLGVTAL